MHRYIKCVTIYIVKLTKKPTPKNAPKKLFPYREVQPKLSNLELKAFKALRDFRAEVSKHIKRADKNRKRPKHSTTFTVGEYKISLREDSRRCHFKATFQKGKNTIGMWSEVPSGIDLWMNKSGIAHFLPWRPDKQGNVAPEDKFGIPALITFLKKLTTILKQRGKEVPETVNKGYLRRAKHHVERAKTRLLKYVENTAKTHKIDKKKFKIIIQDFVRNSNAKISSSSNSMAKFETTMRTILQDEKDLKHEVDRAVELEKFHQF